MIEWITFLMIMAVGQFSPGPDMVLLTRVSLADGTRAGLATACGVASGLMIHAGIAVSGLAFVFERNEMVYRWIKYLACGYLLWLAYNLIKSAVQNVKFKLDALLKLKVQLEDSVKTKLGKAIQTGLVEEGAADPSILERVLTGTLVPGESK